jgi:CO dehydrogenase/acetyl-CoA synthase delta subunit
MFYTEHPFDWADFCRDKYGEDEIAALRLVSTQPVKWTPVMREEIYLHLQAEAKKMAQKRSQGVSGRIEFDPHEYMHVFGE